MKIDREQAVQRASKLPLHSTLDAAFLAVAEQLNHGKEVTLGEAVRLLNNDQILDYAAFLYESRDQGDLDRDCIAHPPTEESKREWELNEEETCLARAISDVAARLDHLRE